jgi:hypothetical protein
VRQPSVRLADKERGVSDDDHDPGEQTPETQLLNQHTGVRELVESLPDFVAWRSTLPAVEIDGELFHVARGDQLMKRDEIIVEWVRLNRPNLLERESGNGQEG